MAQVPPSHPTASRAPVRSVISSEGRSGIDGRLGDVSRADQDNSSRPGTPRYIPSTARSGRECADAEAATHRSATRIFCPIACPSARARAVRFAKERMTRSSNGIVAVESSCCSSERRRLTPQSRISGQARSLGSSLRGYAHCPAEEEPHANGSPARSSRCRTKRWLHTSVSRTTGQTALSATVSSGCRRAGQ